MKNCLMILFALLLSLSCFCFGCTPTQTNKGGDSVENSILADSSTDSSIKLNILEQVYSSFSGSEAESEKWIMLSEDKKILLFDSTSTLTRVGSWEYYEKYYDKYFAVLKEACAKLNIPTYIYEQIGKTSSADGIRQYENEIVTMKWAFPSVEVSVFVIFTLK